MFWFILFLVLLGAGFYFYQRMTALERQIRAEQALEKEHQQAQQPGTASGAGPVSGAEKTSRTVPASTASDEQSVDTAQDPVFSVIHSQPGVLQADIYDQLPQFSKRQTQQMIRQLVKDGKIRRERTGSSYQLYLP